MNIERGPDARPFFVTVGNVYVFKLFGKKVSSDRTPADVINDDALLSNIHRAIKKRESNNQMVTEVVINGKAVATV